MIQCVVGVLVEKEWPISRKSFIYAVNELGKRAERHSKEEQPNACT